MDNNPSYSRSLKGILAYPVLSVGGIAFILASSAMFTVAFALPIYRRRNPAHYLVFIAIVAVTTYLYRIVESTVCGDDRPPKVDADFYDEMWDNMRHYLGGVFVAYMAPLAMVVYAFLSESDRYKDGVFLALLGILVTIGTLYFPMALLLNGFTQRWSTAFNLTVGIRGIGKIGFDYYVCCAYFYMAIYVLVLMWIYAFTETERGWGMERVLTMAVTSIVGIYLFMVKMRALGMLYRKYCGRLNWKIGDDVESAG